MIHHQQCPVCHDRNIRALFKAKDFTVSQTVFPIWACGACEALFTQDVPDEHEIGRYYQSDDYVSHSDTKRGLVNRLYHVVRDYTLVQKKKLLVSVTGVSNGRILDIGCGTGAFLDQMKSAGWSVTGLEPDESARRKAAELYGISPLTPTNLFNLPEGSFHAISMWHVLEHVHDLHGYLEQIRRLLADQGRLFIAVPNHTSADAATYQSYWAAYDVPRHLYHFSPACMRKLLSSHGMKVTGVRPMWFDAFYVSMLSEQYRNSKPSFARPLKGCWHGLISNITALVNREKCSSLIYVIEKNG